jgi:hypothetical protein
MTSTDGVDQLEQLITAVRQQTAMSEYGHGEYFSGGNAAETMMRTRIAAAVERLTPAGSVYRDQLAAIDKARTSTDVMVIMAAGVAEALKADIENGYLRTVEELINANLFADFLEMADELHTKGFKDPAAVLAGSVLEEHLRKMAGLAGVPVVGQNGKPTKADALNADLTKAGAYNGLEQKSVTAWLDLRNKAAHGKYGEYSAEQVSALIRDVRNFVVRHPA